MLPSNVDPLEGKRISQRYRIKTVDQWQDLAIFSTGEDLEKNRSISIVIVDQHTIKNPELFEKHTKRKAKLAHPNIVQFEDFGRTQEEEPFIAIDAVGAKTLAESFSSLGGLSPKQAVEFIISIIEGLNYLSTNGEASTLPLPDRILVSKQANITGRVYNLDFGDSVTQEQLFLMSPSSMLECAKYTPPECIKEKKLDAKSQIYTLACILYRLLTGVNPFDSDDLVELQSQHLAVPPKPFHTVRPDLYISPALESCVMKALSKDPQQRQDSLLKFKDDLRHAIQNAPLWKRRWKEAAGIFLACAAAVYASGIIVQPFWATPAVDPVEITTTDPVPVDPGSADPETTDPSQPDPNAAASKIPPLPADAKDLSFLRLTGGEHKVLSAGNYKCSGLRLSDSAQLSSDGEVSLWIVGEAGQVPLTLQEHASVLAGKDPQSFKIYYEGKDALLLSGDAKLKANVLAPAALLDASGNSTIAGEFISAGQKLTDKARFVGGPEIE